MSAQANLSSVAFLIADPVRAAILTSLLDGRSWPAGELAHVSGITPQTASSHLAKLLQGGLLAVEAEGRHRLYRLAGPHVALALEKLATIGPAPTTQQLSRNREAQEMRFARCCYNHLAGCVGVAVTCGLQQRGFLVAATEQQFDVTPSGGRWFKAMGLDVDTLKPNRRGVARQCLDWTERQPHLAGPLGVQFTALLFSKKWLRQSRASRAVEVTPPGWAGLHRQLGVSERALAALHSTATRAPAASPASGRQA